MWKIESSWEIDVDNFDDRLKSMKPRVAFPVENTLTGEGNLMVDITFENMEDFSPAAIARKVEPLRKLLETRTQLANLLTYMDGKGGAEELINKLMNDPALLQSLAAQPKANAAPAATPAPAPVAAPAATAAPVSTPPAASAPAASTPAESDSSSSGGDDLDDLLNSL